MRTRHPFESFQFPTHLILKPLYDAAAAFAAAVAAGADDDDDTAAASAPSFRAGTGTSIRSLAAKT